MMKPHILFFTCIFAPLIGIILYMSFTIQIPDHLESRSTKPLEETCFEDHIDRNKNQCFRSFSGQDECLKASREVYDMCMAKAKRIASIATSTAK